MQHNTLSDQDNRIDNLPCDARLLHGQYTVEQHLVGGGFGMTYLARDSLDRRVVIKECYPSAFCRRVGLEVRPRSEAFHAQYESVVENFIAEARRLAKLEHPGIVHVHQVFEENNTAYMAMDFVDGLDLLTIRQDDAGRLTRGVLERALRDTLEALAYVHDFDILHRDISPDNLLLTEDGRLTLIDFGAAREGYCRKTRALSAVLSVKDGYSPHEFYLKDIVQTPASDLYSVAATFYHLITGSPPPDSQKRLAALASDCDDPYQPLALGPWDMGHNMLVCIDRALSVPQKDRIQSVAEWLELMDCAELLPVNREHEDTGQVPTWQVRDLDPALFNAITSLVEDTNSHLKPGHEAKALRAMPRHEAVAPDAAEATGGGTDGKAPQRTLVDMFGEPIEDVEAWLKEQDRLTGRTGPKRTAADGRDAQPEAAISGDAERRRSWLRRLLGAVVRGKRRSKDGQDDSEMVQN